MRPVYLFCGMEEFLQEEALIMLSAHILPQGYHDSDCIRVDGQAVPLEEVLGMADTVSLFGGSRLLIVNPAPYFNKGQKVEDTVGKRLLSGDPNQNACIIFCAPEALTTLKIVKDLSALGALYRFEPLKLAAIKSWLKDRAAGLDKTFAPGAMDLFLERTGSELRNIAMELNKLAAFTGSKREIDEQSIHAVTVRALHADIFALTDAAVLGNTPQAMTLLKDLLAAGEPALRILAMVGRQFRLLGEARDLITSGENNLVSALKLHPYAAERLALQARKTDEARIRRAVDLLVRCELDIKSGRIEAVLALETLVVALGSK